MQKLTVVAGFFAAAALALTGCGTESGAATDATSDAAGAATESAPAAEVAQTTETAEPTAQTVAFNENCPTSGRAINASIGTVEHNGKQVGFCCAGCKAGWANVAIEEKDAFVAGEG